MTERTATIALATPETDAAIAERERARGRQARAVGLSRDSCPWRGGMCAIWWLEGWDRAEPTGGAR